MQTGSGATNQFLQPNNCSNQAKAVIQTIMTALAERYILTKLIIKFTISLGTFILSVFKHQNKK